jgi:hypothetical protein
MNAVLLIPLGVAVILMVVYLVARRTTRKETIGGSSVL